MVQNDQQWPSNTPWYVNLLIHFSTFAMNMTRRANGSINYHLMNSMDWRTSSSEKPTNGVKSTDITIDKARDLWFRLYTPLVGTMVRRLPVIFFYHGGGFSMLQANSIVYDDLCHRLSSQLSAFVVSVNYRLVPEHPYTTLIEDCFDTLKFIDTTKIEGFLNNADLNQCFMAGDSAGGNLVHHVTIKANGYKFSRVKLIGNIMIQAFFGGEERTESELRLTQAPFINTKVTDSMWKAFLPEGSNRDHPAVNVFGPNSIDISRMKFPATIVIVGGFDPLQDWQKRYYNGLKKHGKEAYLVEYPNAMHLFYWFPMLPESALFIKDVKDFMQKQSASHI